MFSNGTESDVWRQHWCDRCLHDHAIHQWAEDSIGSCPIFDIAFFMGEEPKVWQPYSPDPWFHLPAHIRCAAFEPCEPCGVSVELRPPVYGEN